MTPLDAYSPDYKTARARFRSEVAERGWVHEAFGISAPGYAEGDLSIDSATIGEPNAERLLLISSGIHGCEGFFGSAVQLAWLHSLPKSWAPPAGSAVRLLHTLNPYGFANIRRANEDNVDLNRNFMAADDFARLREQTEREFGPLDHYLNPPRPPSGINWFPLIFSWMALRFGLPYLRGIMPAGQYSFPKGIFFGGDRLCQTTEIVMNHSPAWVGPAQTVIHLDFHTGLGRFGTYHLLSSDPIGSDRVRMATNLFGPKRVRLDHEIEDGYHNHGDMGEWLSRRFGDRTYVYLCAEFGTYGSTRIIGSLRAENQAHHWAERSTPPYDRAKKQMLEAFSPLSHGWRWSVVHQSLELIQSALQVCTKTSS